MGALCISAGATGEIDHDQPGCRRVDQHCAIILMDDLRGRLANRVQLTTDGHRAYLEAVEGAFGADVDYAQLVTSTVP